MFKSIAVAVLLSGISTSSVLADPPAVRPNIGPLRNPTTLKALGAADIHEGPVEYGQVILSQSLTYARTGVLSAALDLIKPDSTKHLVAGTQMFGIDKKFPEGAQVIWCTIPGQTPSPYCIVPQGKDFLLGDVTGSAVLGNFDIKVNAPKILKPQVDIFALSIDPHIRVTFQIDAAADTQMHITRVIYINEKAVRTENMTMASKHDIVFAPIGGEAVFVTYDAVAGTFLAKRYASEAEALAN